MQAIPLVVRGRRGVGGGILTESRTSLTLTAERCKKHIRRGRNIGREMENDHDSPTNSLPPPIFSIGCSPPELVSVIRRQQGSWVILLKPPDAATRGHWRRVLYAKQYTYKLKHHADGVTGCVKNFEIVPAILATVY